MKNKRHVYRGGIELVNISQFMAFLELDGVIVLTQQKTRFYPLRRRAMQAHRP